MKNLLIYVNTSKFFDKETEICAKIQIDNSLSLGWKKEDILVVTNFAYEYNGVRAFVIGDDVCSTIDVRTNKIVALVDAFKRDIIENGELYWLHDWDAFQSASFTEEEVGLGSVSLGLTTLGWSRLWNTGSIFFKKEAFPVFELIQNYIINQKILEETAIYRLIKDGLLNETQYKTLNITYNVGQSKVEKNYEASIKPLKVLHFHPTKRNGELLKRFMYGENGIGIPLMSKNLIEVFNKHGIK